MFDVRLDSGINQFDGRNAGIANVRGVVDV